MPLLVVNPNTPETLESLVSQGILRNCELQKYTKIKNIPTFSITGDFIAYASPDSTYAVTSRLLNAAQKEILIGIYDFSAPYVKELLLNAMQRKVKVSLMLDIDSDKEQKIFEELARFGCTAIPAPSCASDVINYFHSSHEKVIIVDNEWVMVQSGNFTNNSIPFNEKDGGDPKHFKKGNRDMGVAIQSKPLAKFFAGVLKADMKLQLDAASAESIASKIPMLPELVESVPKQIPSKLFPSKTFSVKKPVRVTPVLTPDNYMDLIPAFLSEAKESIWIENQYIKSTQPAIKILLEAIKSAIGNNPKLDVRIILGKVFDAKAIPKEIENNDNISERYGLKLGRNIRYINTDRFVHCHNKLIIVDNRSVLISSQNWSNTAVVTNREAGVLIEYPAIAKYYASIFESDWSTAFKKISGIEMETITPEGVSQGNFMSASYADYEEV